jgi:hypothetical protein
VKLQERVPEEGKIAMPEARAVLDALHAGYVRIADMPEILGVTQQRCSQLAKAANFPAPVGTVPGRRLWWRADVERWRDETWRRPWIPAPFEDAEENVAKQADPDSEEQWSGDR